MVLKLVRKTKTAAVSGSRKKTASEKFIDAIDVQVQIAQGKKVKAGKGFAKSWAEDGGPYGVERVLKPRVGNRYLYPKSAIEVDTKKTNPPTAELEELRSKAAAGKLNILIGKATGSKKKSA